MAPRFSKYGVIVLVSVCVGTAACGSTNVTSPTEPTAVVSATLTAEPSNVTPEFVPLSFCTSRPAFRARVVIVVAAHRDVILRQLRFGFTDRLGDRALPIATASQTTSFPSIPNSMPIPIPGVTSIPHSTTIPIPGSPAIDGVLLTGGDSRRVPLSLEFGCGVRAAGTLNVFADMSDRRGRADSSEVRVTIGSADL